MTIVVMRHAADDGIFVRLFGQQRHQFANANAGNIRLDRAFQRAAIIVTGLRFGIKNVDVGRAAPHPDLDDGLGLGRGRRGESAEGQMFRQDQATRDQESAANGLAPADPRALCFEV